MGMVDLLERSLPGSKVRGETEIMRESTMVSLCPKTKMSFPLIFTPMKFKVLFFLKNNKIIL